MGSEREGSEWKEGTDERWDSCIMYRAVATKTAVPWARSCFHTSSIGLEV